MYKLINRISFFQEAKREKIDYRLMLPLVLGNMLNPLNSTMLTTALITICHSFARDISSGAILVTVLYLTSTVGQPLMGRLADIFSAKRVNTAGFILVLISAIIGVAAPSFFWLILSRIILGLGTSAAYPSSMAIIRKKYSALNIEVPGIVLGIIAVASQVSIALGPFLGGILSEVFGWRGIFFINIPLAILAIYLSKGIPNTKVVLGLRKNEILKLLDIPGILLFSTFLTLLLIVLMKEDFSYLYIVGLVAASVLTIIWELKHTNPFIDVRLLMQKIGLTATLLRHGATFYIIYLQIYGFPQWLQQSRGISPAKVGFIMLPMSLTSMLIALLVSKNQNFMKLLLYGFISICLACAGLFFLNEYSLLLLILFISLLFGVCIGINTIANQVTLYAETPKEQTGVSFGLYRTMGYIGAIVSGSQLKHIYKGGATDSNFHKLAFYSLICCVIVLVLLIPNIYEYYFDKKGK